MHITNPRGVTLNGVRQASIPLRNVHGALVWLYIPDQGRYVMSLTPHPDLNFKKAGEVRGGVISFTVDGDRITLECPSPIAPGDAPYHLYILHDEDWEPISEAQKLRPSLGSVSPAELTALKKINAEPASQCHLWRAVHACRVDSRVGEFVPNPIALYRRTHACRVAPPLNHPPPRPAIPSVTLLE